MDEVVQALADVYRRRGYTVHGVPVAVFLDSMEEEQVQEQLAELLEVGAVVVARRGAVSLAPNLRLAILNEMVLRRWTRHAEGQSKVAQELITDAIREEVGVLAAHASEHQADLPDSLVARAAELAGVLAVSGVEPSAMELVAMHGSRPDWKLNRLLTLEPASCLGLEDLRKAMRRLVSTQYADPARSVGG